MVSQCVIAPKFDNLQKKSVKRRRCNAAARFQPTEAIRAIIYNTESQYFAIHSPDEEFWTKKVFSPYLAAVAAAFQFCTRNSS